MPKVNGKKFPYTKEGMKQATAAKNKIKKKKKKVQVWYLLVLLHLPLQDKQIVLRFDDFRSESACMLGKMKLMQHQANLLKETGKDTYVRKIECREVEKG